MTDSPVTQSSVNSDIISTKIAARLPEKIQSFVNSLDRAELKALRASLSKHWHFDFLELPLELRESIYEFIFEGKGSQPTAITLSRRTTSIARSDLCSTAILSTCRQIHQEASNVLYRQHPAKLIVNQKAAKFGYKLQSIDVAASTGFTRLDVDISVNSDWLYIEYGQKRQGTLGHLLSTWVDRLVSALQPTNSGGSRTINMNVRLSGWLGNSINYFDDVDELLAKTCWFRVQIAAAVQEMRQDLHTRLPAIEFTITSDVEAIYPWLRVVRESAFKLQFHHSAVRKVAHLSMGESQRLTIEWQKVGLDDKF
ncbi:hypothetical protein E2P81_ATG08171 [Venturia nashicola]|uniref:F-box domain-containing protein n=1 Tax=Venturia nashicola TaxID=86259 RepID=A0A4Z1NPZ5_9PEZI|nr:hypothetical protein E6O75_ATG08348 [Venturia nashicola]TLD21583.1 hypothetical protein E2P81_ATG08171 [Venturia nashicola]